MIGSSTLGSKPLGSSSRRSMRFLPLTETITLLDTFYRGVHVYTKELTEKITFIVDIDVMVNGVSNWWLLVGKKIGSWTQKAKNSTGVWTKKDKA